MLTLLGGQIIKLTKFSVGADLEIKSQKPLMYKCDSKGAFRHEITWTADAQPDRKAVGGS